MGTLIQIGTVSISDADFAIAGWPALSLRQAYKPYALGNGKEKTRRIGAQRPTITINLIHAPGQPFGGDLFEGGGAWWGKIQPIVALHALEQLDLPLEVSLGSLDIGTWYIEGIDVAGDGEVITSPNDFTSSTFDIRIRLKADEETL